MSVSSIDLNRRGAGAAVGARGAVSYLQPGGVITMKVNTTSHSLNDICFLNPVTACAAGSDGSILRLAFGQPSATTAIPEAPAEIPASFTLSQNYPNPFNPTTVIEYSLPEAARVTLKIFNVLGQEVKTLVDELDDAGDNSVEWQAGGVASGIYFYRLA